MTSRRLAPCLFPAMALCLLAVPRLSAQLTVDAPAPSRVLAALAGADQVPRLTLPAVDVAALLAEDVTADRAAPYRFGAEIPVQLDLKQLGLTEQLPDGGTLYRLGLASDGAFAVGLEFSEYRLPLGAGLWVHAADGSETLGSYTSLNNKENGEFAIQPVGDDAIVIEYVEPAGVAFPGQVVIGTVIHDYRNVFGKGGGGYSAAGACNVDVNCPQGQPWQKEKRAVARILSGGFLCSGSLVNNSANDGTQYFWSANHCGGMNNAIFLFNFEKSGCGSGSAPSNQTVQGSTLIATSSNVDYRLLRITEQIPASYNVYYLGWNHSGVAPPNTVTIHHPSGDVKKISFDNQSPTKSGVNWHISQWDLGVTEPGSSGCPLMDDQGRLIGELCCGAAACGFPFDDFYGRVDLAWSAVSSALDPTGSGASTLAGFDPGTPSGSWVDLGLGTGGLFGVPHLTGNGSMAAGSTVTISLSGGLPFGTTNLIAGFSQINLPFKGGVIVPNLDVLLLGLSLTSGGSLDLSSTWPAGVPSGTSAYYQHWLQDSTGPNGLTSSNGLKGTTP